MKWVHVVDTILSGLSHPGDGGEAAHEPESKLLEVSDNKTRIGLELVEQSGIESASRAKNIEVVAAAVKTEGADNPRDFSVFSVKLH